MCLKEGISLAERESSGRLQERRPLKADSSGSCTMPRLAVPWALS